MDLEIPDPRWKDLYRLGFLACIAFPAAIVIAIIAFFIWPYTPGVASVADIFDLLQDDTLEGLISLDLYVILLLRIMIPQMLAVYVAVLGTVGGAVWYGLMVRDFYRLGWGQSDGWQAAVGASTWEREGRCLNQEGNEDEREKTTMPTPHQPACRSRAGQRHPGLEGDSGLGERPGRQAPGCLTIVGRPRFVAGRSAQNQVEYPLIGVGRGATSESWSPLLHVVRQYAE
jgi:hypothetical protein